MSKYASLYRALDVVEGLSPHIFFDYSNPECCVFGLARTYVPECRGLDLVRMKKLFGLNADQLVAIYGGMYALGNMPFEGLTSRSVCVNAMRRLLASWETADLLAAVSARPTETVLQPAPIPAYV